MARSGARRRDDPGQHGGTGRCGPAGSSHPREKKVLDGLCAGPPGPRAEFTSVRAEIDPEIAALAASAPNVERRVGRNNVRLRAHCEVPRLERAGQAGCPVADVRHICGNVKCTSYYSRDYPKKVSAPAADGGVMAFTGVMVAICSRGGPHAIAACGGAAAGIAGFSFGAIKQAAENSQCAAFVSDLVGHSGYFRTDNSGYVWTRDDGRGA